MSGARWGLGPHEIRGGVIYKQTTTDTPRDRCFMDECQKRPTTTITYYNRQVAVCTAHRELDGMGN